MRRLMFSGFGLAALLVAGDGYAQGSKAENYSDKPPAILFNSDCTGSGCHSGPQGLARGKSTGDLSSYLREHYTNSKESAAAMAGYLAGVPGANSPRLRETARETGRERPRDTARREPPPREEPKRDESQSIFPSFGSLFSSPTETVKPEETPPPPRSRTGRRDEAAPPPRQSSKREPPPRQEPKQEEGPSLLESFQSLFSSPPEAKREEAPKPRARKRNEATPASRPAEPPRDESSTQVLSTTEAIKRDEAPKPRTRTGKRNESAPPAAPSENSREESAQTPSTTEAIKRDEAPKPRTRTGKRNESMPTAAPSESRREESALTPPSDSKHDETSSTTPSTAPSSTKPPARPATARRDSAVKPSGEGDRQKPARSRAPSHQIPNIGEPPNSINENEIYRPARPHTEQESRPPTTATATQPDLAAPPRREQIPD